MGSSNLEQLKISWHIILLQFALAAAGCYRVAYLTVGYAILCIMVSLFITPKKWPTKSVYVCCLITLLYSLAVIVLYLVASLGDVDLTVIDIKKLTTPIEYVTFLACDVIVVIVSIIAVLVEKCKHSSTYTVTPRDWTNMLFLTLPMSFLIDPSVLNILLVLCWITIFGSWIHTPINEHYYMKNITMNTISLMILIYYAVIVLNFCNPKLFNIIYEIRNFLGLKDYSEYDILPTRELCSYLFSMLSLFFSLSRVGARGAVEKMDAESKRKLIVKPVENKGESDKKWKQFVYSFQKICYFIVCSPWGFAIFYGLIYVWIYLFPNTFTPFSLVFILLDVFFIYSPRGVDKKYQKFGFGITYDSNVQVEAHKKDLLLIPSTYVRDFIFAWLFLLLLFNFYVSSDGLTYIDESSLFSYIFRGGKDQTTLEFNTLYQFIIILSVGFSNKLTCMKYTYYLFDNKKSLLPKTENKVNDTSKNTPASGLTNFYNTLNTLRLPLINNKTSPASASKPTNNKVGPKSPVDSALSDDSEDSETDTDMISKTHSSIVEATQREESDSDDHLLLSNNDKAVDMTSSSLDTHESPIEATKPKKKNGPTILLSIYYYLNILFILGFCISLLWSVDILMGFEIIMVLISINVGRWGICLVYNAVFLIIKLLVAIYFDENCKTQYPWFSLLGFEGLQNSTEVVPVYISNIQIIIPCIIMILNAFIYMITYYDFYNNDPTIKTQYSNFNNNKFNKFVQNNWVWVLYLYMLFLIFSDVPNMLNMLTLFFFIILNTRHLYSKESYIMWRVISVLEIAIFVYQYLFLFDNIRDSFTKWYMNQTMSQYITVAELGIYKPQTSISNSIANGGIFLYLFPAFILTLLCYYRSKFVKSKQIQDEDRKRHPEKYRSPPTQHGPIYYRFEYLYRWIAYLLYLHSSKITMIIVFCIMVSKQSALTGILLILNIFNIYLNKHTTPRWKNCHYIYACYSTVSFIILYIFQFSYFGVLLEDTQLAFIFKILGLTRYTNPLPEYTPILFSSEWSLVFSDLFLQLSDHFYIFIMCCFQYICIHKGFLLFGTKCAPPKPAYELYQFFDDKKNSSSNDIGLSPMKTESLVDTNKQQHSNAYIYTTFNTLAQNPNPYTLGVIAEEDMNVTSNPSSALNTGKSKIQKTNPNSVITSTTLTSNNKSDIKERSEKNSELYLSESENENGMESTDDSVIAQRNTATTPNDMTMEFTFDESEVNAAVSNPMISVPDSSNELNNQASPSNSPRHDLYISTEETTPNSMINVQTPLSSTSSGITSDKRKCTCATFMCSFLDVIINIITTIFYFIHDNLELCTTICTLVCMSISCGSDNIIAIINVFCLWFITPSLKPSINPLYISFVNVLVVIFMFTMLIWTNRNEYIILPSWMGSTASHYFFIEDVTSMYLMPNLLNIFFCVLLYQIRKEVYGYNKVSEDYINKADQSTWELVCSFVMLNLTRIIQIFIFLVSANLPNIFTGVYFIFSIYYIISPEKIRPIDNKPLLYLRIYALIHLIVIVIYQFPFIPDTYTTGDFPLMAFLGLHKLVMRPYKHNPICQDMQFMNVLRDDTYCSTPMELDGLLFLSLITALLQILDLVQKRPSYKCVLKYYEIEQQNEPMNLASLVSYIEEFYSKLRNNLLETRMFVNKKVGIILQQVQRIQQDMFKKSDPEMSLCSPPEEVDGFATSPYSAHILILKQDYFSNYTINGNTLVDNNTKNVLLGYVVSWEEVPRPTLLEHAYGEVFCKPAVDEDGYIYIDITTLLPEHSYVCYIYALYENGRSVPIKCSSIIKTPSYGEDMNDITTNCYFADVGEVYKHGSFQRGKLTFSFKNRTMTFLHKSKETVVEYDLNKVVRCTMSRGITSSNDSIDICFITPWSSYTYVRIKEFKGLNITQLTDLFNKLLPFAVKQEKMLLEDNTSDKSVYSGDHASTSAINKFKAYINSFNTWEKIHFSEYFYLVILCIYTLVRNDIFSFFLINYTYCYALLNSIHMTKDYFKVVLIANIIWLIIKYIIQTPIICQFVDDGVYVLHIEPFCQVHFDNSLTYNPLYLFGLYKTKDAYNPPFMGDFIFDLILFIIITFHIVYLQKNGLWKDSISHILATSEQDIEADKSIDIPTTTMSSASMTPANQNQDTRFTYINKELYESMWCVRLYKISPLWLQDLLLETIPEVYEYKFNKNHPHKFGYNNYFGELVVQLITLVFALLLFSAMTKKDYSQLSNDLTQNQIEASTLIFVVIYFVAIIWNRQIYITRNLFMKVIYHYIYCLCMTTYLIFVVPVTTQKDFLKNPYLVIFFIIQLVYMQISADQIRKGYPNVDKNIKDMLNESYTMVPRMINMAYTSIPFLFELSEYISWSFTTTALNRYDWMMVQSIQTTLFDIKCKNDSFSKDTYKQQSKPRPFSDKCINGILYIAVIIIILLLPLIIFSNGSPALAGNPVITATATIDITTSHSSIPLYDSKNIATFKSVSTIEYTQWQKYFPDSNHGSILPSDWSNLGQIISIPESSFNTWSVSETVLDYIQSIKNTCNTDPVSINMKFAFTRANPPSSEVATNSVSYKLNYKQCVQLANAVNLTSTEEFRDITLNNFLPRLYQLGSSTTATSIDTDATKYNDILLSLEYRNQSQLGPYLVWNVYSNTPANKNLTTGIDFWVVNMNTVTGIVATGLSSLGGTGIIGLYVVIIVTISSAIRSFLIPATEKILYLTLEDPRLLLELLHAMYICRALQYPGHLKDEAKISKTILRIFRSPELLGALTEYPPTYKVLMEDGNIKEINKKQINHRS